MTLQSETSERYAFQALKELSKKQTVISKSYDDDTVVVALDGATHLGNISNFLSGKYVKGTPFYLPPLSISPENRTKWQETMAELQSYSDALGNGGKVNSSLLQHAILKLAMDILPSIRHALDSQLVHEELVSSRVLPRRHSKFPQIQYLDKVMDIVQPTAEAMLTSTARKAMGREKAWEIF